MHALLSSVLAFLDVALSPADIISYYFDRYHIGLIAAGVAVLVVAAVVLLVIFTRKKDKTQKAATDDKTHEQK